MSEWISVKERLPEEDLSVLCVEMKCSRKYPNLLIAYLQDGKWHHDNGIKYYEDNADYMAITHWQSLPEPPVK